LNNIVKTEELKRRSEKKPEREARAFLSFNDDFFVGSLPSRSPLDLYEK
jgi:hypothetical protein